MKLVRADNSSPRLDLRGKKLQSYYEEEHLTVTQCKVTQMQDKLAQVQEATVQGQVEADQKKREVAVAEKKLGTGGLTIL